VVSIAYRDLDRNKDWSFFDADCVMTDSGRALIKPLTQASARAFWASQISSEQFARHAMQLPDSNWLSHGVPGPKWLVASAQADVGQSLVPNDAQVTAFLLSSFDLDPARYLYFVLMKECAYYVPLGLFAKCFIDFLYIDDEAPFLLHPESGVFVRFGPNGQTWCGRREADGCVR
jgi:hypothetical protein